MNDKHSSNEPERAIPSLGRFLLQRWLIFVSMATAYLVGRVVLLRANEGKPEFGSQDIGYIVGILAVWFAISFDSWRSARKIDLARSSDSL